MRHCVAANAESPNLKESKVGLLWDSDVSRYPTRGPTEVQVLLFRDPRPGAPLTPPARQANSAPFMLIGPPSFPSSFLNSRFQVACRSKYSVGFRCAGQRAHTCVTHGARPPVRPVPPGAAHGPCWTGGHAPRAAPHVCAALRSPSPLFCPRRNIRNVYLGVWGSPRNQRSGPIDSPNGVLTRPQARALDLRPRSLVPPLPTASTWV